MTVGLSCLILLLVSGRESFAWLAQRLPGSRAGAPVLLGASVAIGWTPCLGPSLGAIITLAASATTIASGSLLLVGYAVGMAVPFVLLLLAYRRFRGLSIWSRDITAHSR